MSMLARFSFARCLGGLRTFGISQIGSRASASSTGQDSVLAQLNRVAELQRRVAAENSKPRKQNIIAEYPDLRELLEM
jgi:DNA ligase-1